MKKLRHILNIAFMLLVLIFIVRYSILHREQIGAALMEIKLRVLIFCFLLLIVGKFFLASNMYQSIRLTGKKLHPAECINIYNMSQLGKYIPGTIFMFVGRVGLLRNVGIDGTTMRNSMIYEFALIVGSAFVYGISVILCVRTSSLLAIFGRYHTALIIFAFMGVVVAGTAFFIWRKRGFAIASFPKLTWYRSIVIALISFFIWTFIGLSYVTLTSTYFPETLHATQIVYITGLYALAYAIGFCVPIAPAGIGVREGVIVLGLTAILPTEAAILSVTLHRVMYFIVDVILGAISFVVHNGIRQKKTSSAI